MRAGNALQIKSDKTNLVQRSITKNQFNFIVTDSEIFKGIQQKDNQTFLHLYQTYKDRIISMVHKNSGTEEDAMDIFQEGIIALWTNIEKGKYQLQENAKIGTYLFALCRNIWISRLRKRKVTKEIDSDTDLLETTDIHALEEEYEKVNQLTQLINRLGDACQKLLQLFYYDKSSLKDIATVMGITEKTAKNNKYRCMQNLRQLYNQTSTAL